MVRLWIWRVQNGLSEIEDIPERYYKRVKEQYKEVTGEEFPNKG